MTKKNKEINYEKELYKIAKEKQQNEKVVGCFAVTLVLPVIILAIYLIV